MATLRPKWFLISPSLTASGASSLMMEKSDLIPMVPGSSTEFLRVLWVCVCVVWRRGRSFFFRRGGREMELGETRKELERCSCPGDVTKI